ncbi:MAG: FAD-dependent oxidoreductase [Candidatus Micrarchaeota archaeon]
MKNENILTISPWLESVPDQKRFSSLDKKIETDVVVVGAGIVGVMTAWHLANKGLRVVILEKNHVATGDTAFTTGFMTRVPDTQVCELEKLYGEEFVKQLFEATTKTQQYLFSTIKENKINCDFSNCSSFYCAYSKDDQVLKQEWDSIKKADPNSSFISGKEAIAFSPAIKEAIKFSNEGKFNVRKFLLGLLALPQSKKIQVFEESEVTDVDVGEFVIAKTDKGEVEAKKLVVATGLPPKFFSELHSLFMPKITYSILAKFENEVPFSDNLFWDTFDPYFYYRRLDKNTVILGGSDRSVSEPPSKESPFLKLQNFLEKYFKTEFKVTNTWSGSLFDSSDGLPYASEHPHYKGKVFVGSCCGFGGNGLVFGTFASSIVADLVTGNSNIYANLLSFSRTKANIAKPVPRTQMLKTGAKEFFKVAKVSDVVEGKPLGITAGGTKLALFKMDGAYYAIDNTCTHAGGSLCDGTIENGAIQCPLHNARFDIKTGAVLGAPAPKAVEAFKVRVTGNDIEVEMQGGTANTAATTKTGPQLFAGAKKNIGYVLKSSAVIIAFWLIQFFYLFLTNLAGSLNRAILLSAAYVAAELIGLALIVGPLAILVPKINYITHRRTLGVWGFTFAIVHMLAVSIFLQIGPSAIFANLNPLENAILFGSMAFAIYLPLYLTSTDWATAKLGAKNWKRLHRLVYLAYLFSVLHFVRINSNLTWNLSKMLAVGIGVLVFALELAAFAKFMTDPKRRTIGAIVYGAFLILLGLVLVYFGFVSTG